MRFVVTSVFAVAIVMAQPPVPSSGNVTLAIDDYNRLVELAAKPSKKADTPPVPYILKSAQMNLAVNGESVTGTIVIEGEVLAKGLQKVPLMSGMVVLDGQRDFSIIKEDGVSTVVLTGPREFSITLTVATQLTVETGRATFVASSPMAGAVTLSLSVPGELTSVFVGSGLITNRSSRDNRTNIEATLTPGQGATLWWASRLAGPVTAVNAPAKEVRFLSDVKTLLSVTDSEVSMAALTDINVVQGEPDSFSLIAPEGFEMTGATDATLTASDVDGKSIRLRVASGAARNHQFLISMVKPNNGSKADVPLLSFEGTQRETGEVLIEGEGAVSYTHLTLPTNREV